MNEQEWLTTSDARAMLQRLRGRPQVQRSRWFTWMATQPSSISYRKAILFVCGCLGEQGIIWGRPPTSELIAFCEDWADTSNPGDPQSLREMHPAHLAARAFDLLQPAHTRGADELMLRWFPDGHDTARHAELLREVFGNPFQALQLEPEWFQAHEGLVAKVAGAIYENRAFGELPILADALEDAGCTLVPLLDHLRGPGPHRRGCWALDIVLGLT